MDDVLKILHKLSIDCVEKYKGGTCRNCAIRNIHKHYCMFAEGLLPKEWTYLLLSKNDKRILEFYKNIRNSKYFEIDSKKIVFIDESGTSESMDRGNHFENLIDGRYLIEDYCKD